MGNSWLNITVASSRYLFRSALSQALAKEQFSVQPKPENANQVTPQIIPIYPLRWIRPVTESRQSKKS